jgi:hypothetical protein
MIISTSDYDPRNDIKKKDVGQNYILSVDNPKTNSDFIGTAFLCRSAVKDKTVYVKIFNAQDRGVFNSETKTIAITDKCVYDVTVNTIPCVESDVCEIAEFVFTLTDFGSLLPIVLTVDYKIFTCSEEFEIILESNENNLSYGTYTLVLSNYIKNSTDNNIVLSYFDTNDQKQCYTLTQDQYQFNPPDVCAKRIPLSKTDFTAC